VCRQQCTKTPKLMNSLHQWLVTISESEFIEFLVSILPLMIEMKEEELERKLKREHVEACLNCKKFVKCEDIGKYVECGEFEEDEAWVIKKLKEDEHE